MIDAFIFAWHVLTLRAWRKACPCCRNCAECAKCSERKAPTLSDWDWSYDDQA